MAAQEPTAPAPRPHGPGLRAQFVSAVAQVTAEAKMALGPACFAMIDHAQTLVLNGTVQQRDATTYSVEDRGHTYTLHGRCPCPAWSPTAPRCPHLVAATLWRRSWALVERKRAQPHTRVVREASGGDPSRLPGR